MDLLLDLQYLKGYALDFINTARITENQKETGRIFIEERATNIEQSLKELKEMKSADAAPKPKDTPYDCHVSPGDAKRRTGTYNDNWYWHIREHLGYGDWAVFLSRSEENEGGIHLTSGTYEFCVTFLMGYMFNDKTTDNFDRNDVIGD